MVTGSILKPPQLSVQCGLILRSTLCMSGFNGQTHELHPQRRRTTTGTGIFSTYLKYLRPISVLRNKQTKKHSIFKSFVKTYLNEKGSLSSTFFFTFSISTFFRFKKNTPWMNKVKSGHIFFFFFDQIHQKLKKVKYWQLFTRCANEVCHGWTFSWMSWTYIVYDYPGVRPRWCKKCLCLV